MHNKYAIRAQAFANRNNTAKPATRWEIRAEANKAQIQKLRKSK